MPVLPVPPLPPVFPVLPLTPLLPVFPVLVTTAVVPFVVVEVWPELVLTQPGQSIIIGGSAPAVMRSNCPSLSGSAADAAPATN